MFPFYSDYFWRQGLPYGIKQVSLDSVEEAFRVVHDPYYKRVAIELYCKTKFERVTYDSALMDFRHLKQEIQTAWYTESDGERGVVRDHYDRVVLIESYQFEQARCRGCQLTSPQGILLGCHSLYYEDLGDPFSGVLFCDSRGHPVLLKKYTLSSDGEFMEMIQEKWDMEGTIDGQGLLRGLVPRNS